MFRLPTPLPVRVPAWPTHAGLARRVGRYLAGSLLLLVAGCNYQPAYPPVRERRVFFNDFEQLAGWLPTPDPSLTTERAHSGRYSVKVGPGLPFSLTYRLRLGDAFSMRPRRMHLSAWAWVEDASDDAQLTFSMSAPNDPQDKSKFYTQAFLSSNWPYKRWTHISRDFDLPPEVSSEAVVAVYVWQNGAPHTVYTDDWELTELH